MARWRRQNPSTDVVACEVPGGLYLFGDPVEMEKVVADLSVWTERPPRIVKGLANGVSLGAAGSTFAMEHGAFVKLTPRSMELLSRFGPSTTGSGSVWGVVRNQGGIAKHLDFTKVALGPSELLSIQTIAVSIAIQAAIKDVKDAIARVERKVDAVLGLIRANRVGDVLGSRRALEAMILRVESDGVISSTDWSSISSVGVESARTIESLRVHLGLILNDVEVALRPGERVKTAKSLLDSKGLLRECLALLVLAEYNFGAWQRLRIAHVASTEPKHLESTRRDIEVALRRQNDEDQKLVARLRSVSDRLTSPSEIDGFFPWRKEALRHARSELDGLNVWFADQRLMDVDPLDDLEYPSTGDSLQHVKRQAQEIGSRVLDAVRPSPDGAQTDRSDGGDSQPAISQGDQADSDGES